jgi:hypothetical protein
MVVALVVVTGLAVGFARLDRGHQAPAPAPTPVPAPPDDRAEKAAREVRRHLDDLVQYLRDTEASHVAHVPMPALHELPPLPSDCLPEEAVADLPADNTPVEDTAS